MSDKIIHVQDDEFDSAVIDSDVPVLVDFWAEWCGPCKMIAPVLDQVADEYGDKIRIVKVDVDSARKTSVKYGVRSIPTLMMFKNGQVEGTKMGMMNKSVLVDFIDSAI